MWQMTILNPGLDIEMKDSVCTTSPRITTIYTCQSVKETHKYLVNVITSLILASWDLTLVNTS